MPSTGCGAVWLARLTGGQEVGGSNPLSPTASSRPNDLQPVSGSRRFGNTWQHFEGFTASPTRRRGVAASRARVAHRPRVAHAVGALAPCAHASRLHPARRAWTRRGSSRFAQTLGPFGITISPSASSASTRSVVRARSGRRGRAETGGRSTSSRQPAERWRDSEPRPVRSGRSVGAASAGSSVVWSVGFPASMLSLARGRDRVDQATTCTAEASDVPATPDAHAPTDRQSNTTSSSAPTCTG